METENNLAYETVALDEADQTLAIIDQTKLPTACVLLKLSRAEDIWQAINTLQVRGAPAIGVAAAIGLYAAAYRLDTLSAEQFCQQTLSIKNYLLTARPTAVNLSWALERMTRVLERAKDESVTKLKQRLHDEAVAIKAEDVWVCRQIGEYGLTLIHDGDGILTHCNAGCLATAKYGTALAPIHLGRERGMNFRVFTDETRPLLQGARLSAYEMQSIGVDTTVICDNMASVVMKNGWVQAVFVGCDRVACNGDVANKIGTNTVAILAQYYHIPFYVCTPTSTIDWDCPNGEGIVIEQRPPEEVTTMWYKEPMAPAGVHVFNPAFDVTDHTLVTAIITEYGIIQAPYEQNLAKLRERMQTEEEG